ncbi:MAG: hypothetical protein LBP95_07455 [Deltaproteobacteria bacterium]|jgi:hypothetical protein|nr:hypothetical protein [Deltaproteobacteria bacterium]
MSYLTGLTFTKEDIEEVAKKYFLPNFTERMKAYGRADGKAKGIVEGTAKGAAQMRDQILHNLNKKSVTDKFIAETVGLSVAAVSKFRKARPPRD